MQQKQEVTNIIPLVEYHFESHRDPDSDQIKFRVIDHHGYSYDIRKGEGVERYGTTFKLSANGELDIIHTTCEYQPKIKISGIDLELIYLIIKLVTLELNLVIQKLCLNQMAPVWMI